MARPSGIALLLAQLGRHTTERFAARMAQLDLTPEHVAVLRIVGQQPGLSQATLAERMGTQPSRVVRLVDELEQRELVVRRRSTTDRRNHELRVPEAAGARIAGVLAEVSAHDAELTRGLSASERTSLRRLLAKVAAQQGLEPVRPPGGTTTAPTSGAG